jgi:CRP/FNR family transcriptional regulator, cyclic AMP receptor protein
MSTTAANLAEIPMFTLLDEAERATLAGLLEVKHYDRGHTIFQFGDAGNALYIVRSGRIQVFVENTQGEKIVLGENEPGDLFGEISLLDGGPRTANAIVIDDCELLELDRDGLLQLVRSHPHAAIDMLTVMGRRLRATDELLRAHVTRNLNVEEQERLTFGQRIADRVASFGGSWTFIITFSVVLITYTSINVFLDKKAWDPYPFILLNLFLSMLAAIQAPVIMMSQNRQDTKDRVRSELDFQVNRRAELEIQGLSRKMHLLDERIDDLSDLLRGKAVPTEAGAD